MNTHRTLFAIIQNRSRSIAAALAVLLAFAFAIAARGEEKPFKVGWSIYPGWMDNALMEMKLEKDRPTFLEQRCKQFGAKVEIVKFKEYIPSVEALAAGKLDACAMTLGEAFSIPTDSGVKVVCILVDDFSNGNDAICVPKGWTWKDLHGKDIMAEEFSVSQYLVWRGLQLNKLPLETISFKNTPGDECSKVFIAGAERGKPVAVATWNPHVLRIKATGKADLLFTSEKIPGEIVDMIVAREDRAKECQNAIKAYIAAHYDVMRYFSDPKTRDKAIRAMTVAAEMKKEDAALFKGMLDATRFYLTPKETAEFMDGADLKEQHNRVREFLKTFKAFKGANPDAYQVEFDSSFVRAAE
ncbi:MAG: hypothetical protein HY360_02765 [Verrucomicrobia bacterium]|nr:hypothetical protein [Verrucomicrobiota bacterium]